MSFHSSNRRSASFLHSEDDSPEHNDHEDSYRSDLDRLWEEINVGRVGSPRKRSKASQETFHFTMLEGKPVVDGKVYSEVRFRAMSKIQKHPSCSCKWANVAHDGRRPQVAIRGTWGKGSSDWSETKVYLYTAMALSGDESPPKGLDTSHRCNNPWCVNPEHICFEANIYNSTRRYCHMFKAFAECKHEPPCIDPRA